MTEVAPPTTDPPWRCYSRVAWRAFHRLQPLSEDEMRVWLSTAIPLGRKYTEQVDGADGDLPFIPPTRRNPLKYALQMSV